MQRLFFSFPAGLPGAGLLLLRVALVLTGLYEAHALLASAAMPPYLLATVRFAVLAALSSVLIGLATPIGSLGLGLGAVYALLLASPHYSALTPAPLLLLNFAVMAVVISTVGPGAISLDARLFGRRKIVFPD